MNLGEIKIQALSLIYPDESVKYDDTTEQGIENAVYELKQNHNFGGLLEASVGAINRAFSQIEAKGLSVIKCVDKAYSLCQTSRDGRVVIEADSDFLKLDKLLCHKADKTYACDFEALGNKIYTPFVGSVYTLVYYTKIPRILRTTKESMVIDLPWGVHEAIPYYVMAELISSEDSQRAEAGKEEFYKILDACEKNVAPCHQCFQIIYSMEG